jgi:hypothetical protein
MRIAAPRRQFVHYLRRLLERHWPAVEKAIAAGDKGLVKDHVLRLMVDAAMDHAVLIGFELPRLIAKNAAQRERTSKKQRILAEWQTLRKNFGPEIPDSAITSRVAKKLKVSASYVRAVIKGET